MSGISVKIREMSSKEVSLGKIAKNFPQKLSQQAS